jgi:FtsP/CotA-like multicopper oxidase with cupredoxin domain
MSTGARLGILAGIIVVAVAAFVIASGGSSDDNSTSTTAAPSTTQSTSTGTGTSTSTTTQAKPAGPPTYTVVVKNAKPVGGIKKIKVNQGDRLRIVVRSDTADEIHVHGYDFMKDVTAGGKVVFNFKATIDGGFEIELENRKQQIAELTVQP